MSPDKMLLLLRIPSRRSIISTGEAWSSTDQLAAMMQPKASDHLLDIGCGIAGPANGSPQDTGDASPGWT
jgi:hypothetical protein